jgi:L-asparaginase/Glu-tRNA(Gln) amidotransferase subunit D
MKRVHRAEMLISLMLLSVSVFASPSFSQDRPTVAIVATGGTIAMKVDPVTHAPVPALSGEDLIAAVPKLKELANIRVVEFSNIPSDYMGPDRWPNLTKKSKRSWRIPVSLVPSSRMGQTRSTKPPTFWT